MNKQSSKAFILKDIISPKVLYYSGNKGSHILYENEGLYIFILRVREDFFFFLKMLLYNLMIIIKY